MIEQTKSGKLLFIFLFIFLSVISLQAEFPDSNDVKLINSAIDQLVREKYDESDSLFTILQNKYPDHPCGPFFKAVVYEAIMVVHEHFELEDSFYTNIKSCIDLGDDLRKTDKHNTWAYYFMSAANFYWSIHDIRKKNTWSAVHKGIRGKNLAQRCLKYDSTNCDVLVGLGGYRYWSSVETEGYNWLPFFGDDRQQGLNDLEKAERYSLFSKIPARKTLIWVYIHEKRYSEAWNLIESMIATYPEAKSLLWSKARLYFDTEKYDSALQVYDQLYDRIYSDYSENYYNFFQISFYRLECNLKLQNYISAQNQLNLCKSFPLTKIDRKRLKDDLKELKDYQKEIESKLRIE